MQMDKQGYYGYPEPASDHHMNNMNSMIAPPSPPESAAPFHFALEIAQQPIRARMCGFGDKDRRQISPPPCVRLRVYDTSGMEVTDISSLDISMFALSVELWSADETTNCSLVQTNGQIHGHHASSIDVAAGPAANSGPTKNLIGTVVATAYKLYDLQENLGIWFVLHDLSVRTEGEFKLKFSFVNLADCFSNEQKSAPVLCSAFSSPFRSYSAKKFPGVIDSTELSKCFAVQGIKIPIRRESKTRRSKDEEQ